MTLIKFCMHECFVKTVVEELSVPRKVCRAFVRRDEVLN